MRTTRLEAFSDGVLAIVLTIMVLELHVPEDANMVTLMKLLPLFVSYLLSFIYIGIYWNNHHHLLQIADKINGPIMWANLHLLFWLSLIPFSTAWMGRNYEVSLTFAIYGGILFMAAIAYWILQTAIIAHNGTDSNIATALKRDFKGRISPILYIIAIVFAFYNKWLSGAIYIAVAFLWLIPDRRIEKKMEESEELEETKEIKESKKTKRH